MVSGLTLFKKQITLPLVLGGLLIGTFIGYMLPQNEINALKETNEYLKHSIDENNILIEQLENDKANLTSKTVTLENQISVLENKFSSLNQSYSDLKEDYETISEIIPLGLGKSYYDLKRNPEGSIKHDLIGVCGQDYLIPASINADLWEINITIISELSWQPVHITVYKVIDEYPPDYSAQPFAPYSCGEGRASISLKLNCSHAYVISIRDAYAKPFHGFIEERWGSISSTEPSTESGQLQSKYTSSVPMIDGIINNSEWIDARLNNISLISDVGTTKEAKLYIMNSENYIYIAFELPVSENANLMILRFADNHGNWDAKHSRWDQSSRDRFWNGTGWNNDEYVNVDCAWGASNNYRIIEWAIPMNSGDDKDMIAQSGNTIKFGIRFGVDNIWVYPEGYAYKNAQTWSEIVIS